jgi:hypothetical protein
LPKFGSSSSSSLSSSSFFADLSNKLLFPPNIELDYPNNDPEGAPNNPPVAGAVVVPVPNKLPPPNIFAAGAKVV